MKKSQTVKRIFPLPFILGFLIALVLLFKNGERWLRAVLLYLSHAGWARQLVSRLPLAWRVAGRFVAGETVEEAIHAVRDLLDDGMFVTMDFLGEHVTHREDAIAARDEILNLLDQIAANDLPHTNVSVKLSQLGIHISEQLAEENMCRILERARRHNNRVRIDMEESSLVDTTLDLYRRLRDEHGFDNTGVVIQSYLYRSEADVKQLIDEGAWIRLCKGAYAEPPDVAFPQKADTDANFIKLTRMMLSEEARQNGVYLGVATHDDAMIEATLAYAHEEDIPPDAYEFQMLYGIRRERQESLVDDGYRMRIYVPYGAAWYPYFVRRLAERPANLWFFVSNFLKR